MPSDPTPQRRTAKDFQFGATIGEGSYSTVYLALDIHTNKTFAIKVLSKRHIVKEDKIKYVNIEKTTLHRLGLQHPGIVQLYYTFQDESSLFFVLDFAEYGELLSIIRKFGSLSETVSKFYMLQIIDAIKFIHLKGVIHRDLKPENILVGHDFNLKITDFGAAKLLGPSSDESDDNIDYNGIKEDSARADLEKKGSFVGTAEYVSPELLKHNSCGFESDVWALGCILYQFFNGNPPFKGATEYLTFEKIINVDYTYRPNYPIPTEVTSLIDSILVAEPLQRPSISQIQLASWFKGIPWNDQSFIWHRKVPRFEPFNPNPSKMNTSTAPYVPGLKLGSDRNVNKSNSYHKLHSQIQGSEFDLIPSLGNKSYQPATKLKKGVMPNGTGLGIVNPSPPKAPQYPRMPLYQNKSQNKVPNQNQMSQNQMNQNQMSQPSQMAQMNHMNMMPQTHQMSQGNQMMPQLSQMPQVSQMTQYMNRPMDQQTFNQKAQNQVPNQVPNQASTRQLQQPYKPQPAPSSPQRSSSPPRAAVPSTPQKPVSPQKIQSSPQSFHRVNVSPKRVERSPQRSDVRANTAFAAKTAPANEIEFREITGLFSPGEKILKLDTILKLDLPSSAVNRPSGQPLNDTLIEQIIQKHQYQLRKTAKPVVTVVTNMARVFFIDSEMNAMMVDLKANQGADYLMYDYEFESVAIDDDEDEENAILNGEEVYGYLILELIKDNRNLIFLKRISDMEKMSLKENVKVVDKSKGEVKLGKNHGWIDCLLMAKDMVAKEKPSGKKPSKPSKSSRPSKPSKPSTDKNKNFAYAAAAAASTNK